MLPAIRVENLGKSYDIGHTDASEGYRTFRETLVDTIKSPLFRLRKKSPQSDQSREFWALKDVGFEIYPGEVVGIIGRNGAGKSTLLKLLSRITKPTIGRIELRGRVGSLLEVGTGFHPELSGRENIFLNGSILGMKRAEVRRRFDEIVDFAEISKFLDLPVKRYSSGMYVRLAFAVAAHLEPEVLLVDEVLAVGDEQFQKKCLGKMGDVAASGRTIFFVSHFIPSIVALTNRCLAMTNGRLVLDGPTRQVVAEYTSSFRPTRGLEYHAPVDDPAADRVESVRIVTSDESGRHRWGSPIVFEFVINIAHQREAACFSFQVIDRMEKPVCHFWLFDPKSLIRLGPGRYSCRCQIPKFRLFQGSYSLNTWLSDRRSNILLENLEGVCPFEICMDGLERPEYPWRDGDCIYLEDAQWTEERLS